ncbi:MAG: Pseudouridine-5'-phosphatase [Geoglossum umbratile]|nr:MAG: Pseudouridine-5'-phosphatase [Geoglossum umbratile]
MSSTVFPPIRACLFDVDGLLINSEDIYTEAYDNILHSYGKPSFPWSVKARQQSRGRLGTSRLLDWLQVPLTVEEWDAKVNAQEELFKKSEPLPGALELLNTLSERTSPPMHIALASSAERARFDHKTSHLPGIAGPFPEACRVFGDDATMAGLHKKPAPDIFLQALKQVNDTLSPGEEPVKPEECLVFEDSIAGVEAGRRAGMRVVWVPHPGLLEVCRGWEEEVLAGVTEKDGEDVGPMVPKVVEGVPQERVKSKDGWAELVTSLEHFPYEHYGIHISS